MKTIKGRFIGNTSCGFVHGHTYRIKIYTDEKYVWVKNRCGRARCPYSSISALANNWEIPPKHPGDIEMPVSNRIWDS